jgi:hypothetical protein
MNRNIVDELMDWLTRKTYKVNNSDTRMAYETVINKIVNMEEDLCSNGDHIRLMTDFELAEFLSEVIATNGKSIKDRSDAVTEVEKYLSWLNKTHMEETDEY